MDTTVGNRVDHDKHECPDCEGLGTIIQFITRLTDLDHSAYDIECDTCEGRGWVRD